jgi:hypothetical protein
VTSVRLKPGPLSTQAFNLGSLVAALLACAAFAACLVYGVFDPIETVVLMTVVLPPYLLLVACGLGVWLGFSRDARAGGRATRHES